MGEGFLPWIHSFTSALAHWVVWVVVAPVHVVATDSEIFAAAGRLDHLVPDEASVQSLAGFVFPPR